MLKIVRIFCFRDGLRRRFEQTVYKKLEDLEKVVRYYGKIFEWEIYYKIANGTAYELLYTEVHPEFLGMYESRVEADFGSPILGCDCGGDAAGQGTHAFWCKSRRSI